MQKIEYEMSKNTIKDSVSNTKGSLSNALGIVCKMRKVVHKMEIKGIVYRPKMRKGCV